MSEILKSIVCPHCGANTTNHDVCEFCGSRIVRVNNTVNTPKILTKEEESKQRLQEALEKNKMYQKKHQEFIDKYPLLGAMIIKRYQYIKVKFDEREKVLNGNIVPRTGVKVEKKKATLGNCHLEIWNANDTNCKFSVHVTPKDWKQNMTDDIFYRNYSPIAIYVAAEKGSDELEKIYAANLPQFKILQTADLINHAQNRSVDCLINCSKYTVFYRDESKEWLSYEHKCYHSLYDKETALILIDIFKALGIDEHNLRYHYWFTNDRTIDDYFDAEGNLMETKPELPSLRIFRRANGTTPAQQPTAAAQTATKQQSQGINFGIIALVLLVVGVILCIVGFVTINVIMIVIGFSMAALGYLIIHVI